MDDSNYHLGAVIIQGVKPIAFYNHKLTGSKTPYTVTEKELLSIFETLKEFCTILLVQQFKICTDHRNLTCKNFNNHRVLWWRHIIEEYSPDINYIPGAKNMVVYALSQ